MYKLFIKIRNSYKVIALKVIHNPYLSQLIFNEDIKEVKEHHNDIYDVRKKTQISVHNVLRSC